MLIAFCSCLPCASLQILEAYDRRDKPSVLVTSPSSPDRVASGASGAPSRYQSRLTPGGPVTADSNIGGRIQIKLGFEPGTLQLILTIICATGLTYRANGATRNPYVKVKTRHRKILQSIYQFQLVHFQRVFEINSH